MREVSRNLEKAAEWARLAQEIAERVPGPEGWRNSNRGARCEAEASSSA